MLRSTNRKARISIHAPAQGATDEVRWECSDKLERMEKRIGELEAELEERDCDKH